MTKSKKIFIKALFLFFSFVLFGQIALAEQKTVVDKYNPACTPESCKTKQNEGSDCYSYCGDFDNVDIALSLVVKVTDMILGVVGSLALLAFIYGGVVFLTSAGSRERVEKGKQIIIGAIIGLVVVFMSYTIVGFVFKSLGVDGRPNILGDVLKNDSK